MSKPIFAIIRKLPPEWRYRLGVRTEDSQSSNPGSIPGSATKLISNHLHHFFHSPKTGIVLAFVLTAPFPDYAAQSPRSPAAVQDADTADWYQPDCGPPRP